MSVYTESSEVLWRDCGEAITIQCRFSNPRQEYLEVKKGLSEDVSVLQKIGNSGQLKIGSEFTGRLQENGAFPNIDILIKNLTSEDTGPYWCLYKMSNESVRRKGKGSVLVVVKGKPYYFIQLAINHMNHTNPPYHYSTGHSFPLNTPLMTHPASLLKCNMCIRTWGPLTIHGKLLIKLIQM